MLDYGVRVKSLAFHIEKATRRLQFACKQPVSIPTHVRDHEISFSCSSLKEYELRALNSYSGEPETVRWIIDVVAPEGSLLDVGANVGAYSLLYAMEAQKLSRGDALALALEPEASNFASLQRNIRRNGLSDIITGLPLAASPLEGVADLHLSSEQPGSALHSMDPSMMAKCVATQGVWCVRLDRVVSIFPENHLLFVKIDVDGYECDVLHSAGRTLADERVQGMLVEVDKSTEEGVRGLLLSWGFRLIFEAAPTQDEMCTRNQIYTR